MNSMYPGKFKPADDSIPFAQEDGVNCRGRGRQKRVDGRYKTS